RLTHTIVLPIAWALTVLCASAQAQVLEGFEQGSTGLFTFIPTDSGANFDNLTIVASAAHDGSLGANFAGGELDSGWYLRNYEIQVKPGQTIYGFVRFHNSIEGLIANGGAYIGVGATRGGTLSMVASTITSSIRLQINDKYGFETLA